MTNKNSGIGLYHKNPRHITEKQYKDLERWLEELGDLSGVVHDLNSNEVIAGNQRSRVFDINDCEIVIFEEFEQPDKQGTVALGYVIWKGSKYNYRQVRWTEKQCEMASIIANKAGGAFDFDILANEFEIEDLLDWGFEEFELGLTAGELVPNLEGWDEPESSIRMIIECEDKEQVLAICEELGLEFEPGLVRYQFNKTRLANGSG